MMVTYYTMDERERYKEVEDKELNEIYQEARQVKDFFIREYHFNIKKWIWSKPKRITRYGVYGCINNVEVQCLNFLPNPDSESSINTYVGRDVVFAFCMGLLAKKASINIEDAFSKVNRLEIINHADNNLIKGRVNVFKKQNGHFDNVETSFQDDGRTLKIYFVNTPKK